MKNMTKMVMAVLAVGLLVWGVEGVALADHNNPNLPGAAHPGYAPDSSSAMDTNQPGWKHTVQGGAFVGYPSDSISAPGTSGWIPTGPAKAGVGATPPMSQAQPVVPVAPFLGNDQRSSHNS